MHRKALCADAKVFLVIAATLRQREQEIVPPATSGAIKPIQISYIFWGLKSGTGPSFFRLVRSGYLSTRQEYFDCSLSIMMRQLQNLFLLYVLLFLYQRLNTFLRRMQQPQIRFSYFYQHFVIVGRGTDRAGPGPARLIFWSKPGRPGRAGLAFLDQARRVGPGRA
jgi:hypothetical protein